MLVNPVHARTLPLQLRMGWACTVVDRIALFFSPHARAKYLLAPVLDSLWQFVEKGETEADNCFAHFLPLNRVYLHFESGLDQTELDEEGYSFGFASLGIVLLNELRYNDGSAACAAVYQAASCYATHLLYRQGVGQGDFELGYDVMDTLARPAWDYIRVVYQGCVDGKPTRVIRGMFASIPFPSTVPVVRPELLATVPTRPPQEELAYIRQSGWLTRSQD
jgi:hypothetical protein